MILANLILPNEISEAIGIAENMVTILVFPAFLFHYK